MRVRWRGTILAGRWARHGAAARVGGVARAGCASSNGRRSRFALDCLPASPYVRSATFFGAARYGDFPRASRTAAVFQLCKVTMDAWARQRSDRSPIYVQILLVKSPQGDKRSRHSVLWLSLTG